MSIHCKEFGLRPFSGTTPAGSGPEKRLRRRLRWLFLPLFLAGCQTPAEYRREADSTAGRIIQEKQQQALNKTEPFTIERPGDLLRRRLLIEQHLPYAGEASLGADKLPTGEHWPEKDYPRQTVPADQDAVIAVGKPLQLSLVQALQVGARNNFDYQTSKENVFRAALDLDLERNFFRNLFNGRASNLISTDLFDESTVTGSETNASLSLTRTLKSGAQFTAALAVDLVKLLTQDRSSSFGIVGDATITIPLLRGSGAHIVAEPLTQAERNVVYALWEFEQFKKILAVGIARDYLDVLRRILESENAAENYRNLIASSRRSRRLADAGRATEIDVNQSVQNELRAKNRWLSAKELSKSRLDAFKRRLGLPPDAEIRLDRGELDRLFASTDELMKEVVREAERASTQKVPPADEPIELVEPGHEKAGPLEMESSPAVKLALENRHDLRIAEGKAYDAQRKVVVFADALGAELTLFGSARMGEGRTLATSQAERASLRPDRGFYTALLTLDLPFERTAERNDYRNSLIVLERAVREVQEREDEIKLAIRNDLRTMFEARESRQIQARALFVAENRVKSTTMFFEAGRTQIRELLDAQEALINARNALISAVVDYRVAELDFQRDAGVLQIDERGIWREFSPGEIKNDKQ